MGKLNWSMRACGICLLWAATAVALPAQTFTTLHSFDGTEGDNPNALVQSTNGTLYGTTVYGGGANDTCTDGCGTIFRITPSGTLTTLYNFCAQSGCTDGANPNAKLVQATNGYFYGTTTGLGVGAGYGTVFRITPEGALTTLYNFCSQSLCADGEDPVTGLIQATDRNFYGTTFDGGANGYGTVFKITPNGTLTTLHNFDKTEAVYPSGLIQATNGNFYGTTQRGGVRRNGTVFKITPSGTLTTLYNFCSKSGCTDGYYPEGGVVQGIDGNFYGTTYGGGGSGGGGTVFKITPNGKLTTLYSFCQPFNCADGENPGGLVQATDGNFYGTTLGGGANSVGTVFKIAAGGVLTTLYSFCQLSNCADGGNPEPGLVQDTSGTFYGTTGIGGANGYGTVFSLSVGLGPFVETNPTSGKVGAAVNILGTSLTGATSLTFNGTAATFSVKSKSEITTSVPIGATSGTVQVVTPSGTLSSNVPFTVK